MNDEGADKMCYVGKAPCGCYRYAAVIEEIPRVDMAKDIQKMIRAGFIIEQKSVQWVRDGGLNFDCQHEQKPVRKREKGRSE